MAIKEISRRVNFFMEEGIACGPVSIGVIEAEIELEDDGEKVYLFGEWVDAAGEYTLVASKKSIYDVIMQFHEGGNKDETLMDEHNRLIEEAVADDPRYEPFFEELKAMIDKEREAQGYEIYDDDEFEVDDEE